ncbi:hypothetical protein IM793_02485 [Pedobacter sp. MR2016-19]|uniref:hypothetical protein n=1 Tax=Pedobacter sp. MR2016-19 TaxID=2780089 RepID=UPI001876AA2A|nr:hypothetical protein [Pedobacter sp. MR2016-19]MBE5318013.1 hypothetical protein [Pedobacter sp. MR2016-19]
MANQYSLSNTADVAVATAAVISNNIHDNFQSLSINEILTLNEQARSLLVQARLLYELESIEISDNVSKSLDALKDATADIEAAIKTIKNVQKIIDISAKVVVLAASILSENYAAIPGNVKDIISAVK